MSRPLAELDLILQQMIAEHRKMLTLVDRHQAAMKTVNLQAMDEVRNQQEAARMRVVTLENKRRALTQQIAKALKLTTEPRIPDLAKLDPTFGPILLKRREELKAIMEEVGRKSHVAGRLAGAFLGHLNTVVRVIAGAVEQAGLYTKQGVPKVSARIGVIEAVG